VRCLWKDRPKMSQESMMASLMQLLALVTSPQVPNMLARVVASHGLIPKESGGMLRAKSGKDPSVDDEPTGSVPSALNPPFVVAADRRVKALDWHQGRTRVPLWRSFWC
jgi:hypothetical protein